MNQTQFRLLMAVPVSEEELSAIPDPRGELEAHVILKTVQLGTVVGAMVAGPALALARPASRSLPGLKASIARCGPVGAALGIPLGWAMMYGKTWDMPHDPIFDRAYRLRCSDTQHRADRFYVVGTAAGSLLGKCTALSTSAGFSFFGCAGLVLAGLYNAKVAKKAE